MALKYGKRLAVVAGVAAMAGGIEAAPSWAQGTRLDSELAQAGERRSFNIPPQPLQSALVQFGQQSGRQIGADNTILRGVNSPGVQGSLSIEEALQRLLAGTGLTYSVGATVISVQRAGQGAGSGALQLDPVQVQGTFAVPQQAMIDNVPPPYAGGQVATGAQLGLLGNRGVMDTPFNQTGYTAQKAQNQQAKTIRDVLVDDPSVRFFRLDGGLGDNGTYIRGFPVANSNVAYGGLYGVLPTASIMTELAERVEILKGPSVMLGGMPPGPGAAIGGTINIVPKRAHAEALTQATLNYTSGTQFGGHVDLARRFGAEQEFGVRFNGVYGNGQTDVQWNTNERALAVLGLDFRGDRFRVSADFGYQFQEINAPTPYLGVANGVPLPWAPSARNNAGAQPWSEVSRKDFFGVLRAEFDLTDNVTAYAAFGAHDYRFGGLYPATLTATNFYGTATSTNLLNQQMWNSYRTGEIGVRGTAVTGIIEHEFAVIGSTFYNDGGVGSVTGPVFASNFYNPTLIAKPNLATPNATKTTNVTLASLAIADTLSAVDKRIQLTLGGRLQQVQATNFNAVSGLATSGYSQSAFSPSAALIFKPWDNVSLYGNFIQGLQQGGIVGATFANAGEAFAPYKSTQYEVGVKVDWGKLTTTASVFQITQPSVLTNTATNTQYVGGEQRNQGLELNFFGELAEGVRILGGAMFLSGVLTKTQGGTMDGWIAPFSPGAQFNLAGEIDLPFVSGLTLSGRMLYTGAQFFDTTLPRRTLPEWTRFDVGVRYAFENPGAKDKLLIGRFNVDNLLDSNYWLGGTGATNLNLSTPRTFRVSLTADF
jgi:iron complex outermembrane receptor protein